MNGIHALRGALADALSSPRVKVLGEAVELSPVTRGLREQFPDQVVQLPASDAGLVGIALGMAMNGDQVVVELAGPASVGPAMQALREAETCSEMPLSVILRVPYGPDHLANARLALEAGPPVRHVVAIGRPDEAAGALRGLLDAGGPAFLFEPLSVLSQPTEAPGAASAAVDVRAAALLREGDHATVLAWGHNVPEALAAADALAEDGLMVDVIDVRNLTLRRDSLVVDRVRHTGRPVVATVEGYDVLLGEVMGGAFLRLEAPVGLADLRRNIVEAVRTSLHY